MPTLSLFFLMMEQPPQVLAVCCSVCCLLLKIHALFLAWICQLQLPAVRSSYIFIWRVLFPLSVPQIDAMINSSLKMRFVKINCLSSWVFLLRFPVPGLLWSTLTESHYSCSVCTADGHSNITCLVLIDILHIERQSLLFCATAKAWGRCSPSSGNICYNI